MPTAKIDKLDPMKLSRVFAAAVKEFSRVGFHDASYNQILKTAKMSKGAAYYYFESKDDLFAVLLNASLRKLKANLTLPMGVESPIEYWQENQRLAYASFTFVMQTSDTSSFMRNVLAHPDAFIHSPAGELIESIKDWLHGWLDLGRELGAIHCNRPNSYLIAVIWQLWKAEVDWAADGGDVEDAGPFIRQMESLLSPQ